ncbi:MAG: SsrA-binding protein SmpB [bacterium]
MITNKEARRDFEITDTMTAGVMLTGAEVKSLREGRGNMKGSHARIIGGEVFLLGVDIPKYTHYSGIEYDSKRTRKLLLKNSEIAKLTKKMEGKAVTLIPLRLFFGGRWAKVEVGIGRGRKEYEKREVIKKRDVEREISSAMKKASR